MAVTLASICPWGLTTLMPVPSSDFDPTETAIPWSVLTSRGGEVAFATPDGSPGRAVRGRQDIDGVALEGSVTIIGSMNDSADPARRSVATGRSRKNAPTR